jgi:putative phosphoribosyl transferase
MEEAEDMVFKNRRHAGEELGKYLAPSYGHLHPLVLGIPRGGAEVAWYVARELETDLALVITKKLPLPGHQEYGIGSIAEDYSVYISPRGRETLSDELIREIIETQKREIDRRVKQYRPEGTLPDMKGRIVLLVDDGIATGVTLIAAIRLCRQKEAALIIVAVPVAGHRYDQALDEADGLEVLVQPEPFQAVGQAYEEFGEFTDEQLAELMSRPPTKGGGKL